ncbi:MAG: 6-bladed beta-propeller [Balneolales bacterium]|nr:6-bladed beta-propeller [Balneolales bacterium]
MKNYFIFILAAFLLCIAVMGCSSDDKLPDVPEHIMELENLTVYSRDAELAATFTFQKDASYGDTEEVIIGRIQDVAVDGSGRVFVADTGRMVIHVFEPEGQYNNQLGRDGRGPREFSFIKSIQIIGDQMFAFDSSAGRVNIFSLENLSEGETVSLGQNRSNFSGLSRAYPAINHLYARTDGTYLVRFISTEENTASLQHWQNFEMKGLYYLLGSAGNIQEHQFDYFYEKRVMFPSGNAALGIHLIDFLGTTQSAISNKDQLYLAKPDNFLVKSYGPDGVYRRAFYFPIKKVPLTLESAIEAGVLDMFTSNMSNMDLPEFWPVVTDLRIDNQNRLWVATTVDDMSIYEWWVLENTGELITRFDWPRNKPIKFINDTHIYTIETDDETDLQKVVRYRIEVM